MVIYIHKARQLSVTIY